MIFFQLLLYYLSILQSLFYTWVCVHKLDPTFSLEVVCFCLVIYIILYILSLTLLCKLNLRCLLLFLQVVFCISKPDFHLFYAKVFLLQLLVNDADAHSMGNPSFQEADASNADHQKMAVVVGNLLFPLFSYFLRLNLQILLIQKVYLNHFTFRNQI